MKIALIQLSAGQDKQANLAKALTMSQEAIASGAKLICLPEVFNWRGNSRDEQAVKGASEAVNGPSVNALVQLAKEHKVNIAAGSIFEKAPGGKPFNTAVFINAKGQIKAKYRKIHLFDARLGDRIIKEAFCFRAGKQLATAQAGDFKLAFSICYDLRFPKLYADYAKKGADVLMVPSCFTQKTGAAHWEVLLRARAIENLSYVLAANQVGEDFHGVASYGNSMIVDPWGQVVARGSNDKEEIVYGEISVDHIIQAREKLPGIRR